MRLISVYKYTGPRMTCSPPSGGFQSAWTCCALSHETDCFRNGREAFLRTASFSQRSALYRISGRTYLLACLLVHDDTWDVKTRSHASAPTPSKKSLRTVGNDGV